MIRILSAPVALRRLCLMRLQSSSSSVAFFYHFADECSNSRAKLENRLRAVNEDVCQPTPFERRMLVVSGIYPRASDVPPHVPRETMERYKTRIRMSSIVFFCSMFLVAEVLNAWRKEHHHRRAGKHHSASSLAFVSPP